MLYDYLVIAGYFALMITISFVFKRMATNSTSDYFRGGGRMMWWMVGSSAFMAQFSAWTFTGASGKAFTDGLAITFVFVANTAAYFVGWLYFAKRFRQMRVDTPTEGIRRRFGHGNELFFSWALIVFGIINGGVWLNALGVFTSTFLQADLAFTIVGTGVAILFISVMSGAWGVVASDFVQTLVVAVMATACAIVALVKVGGPAELVARFPSDFVMGPAMNYPLLLFCTFVFFLVKQMITIMNLNESYRFLTAKDSREASRASLLATILMGFGSIIFFIPPWAAAILYPTAPAEYGQLGGKAADAVYLLFTQRAMPVGTVGLLMAGLFAATMSSMDGSLNKASGIFVRSVYQPFLARRDSTPSDQSLLRVSMVVSTICGVLTILAALFFNSLQTLSLFELMMNVSVLIQVPLMVPLLFGLFIRRTPAWAPWATVAVGLFVSWLMTHVLTAQVFADWLGMEMLTAREVTDTDLMLGIAAHLFITANFFCLTSLFYREKSDANREATALFFDDLKTEIVADSGQQDVDRSQREKLGAMVIVMGLGMLAMVLIPNPVSGRVMFAICAVCVLFIGWLLKRGSRIHRSAMR